MQSLPGGDLGTGRLLIHLEEGKRKGKEKRRREGEMKREKKQDLKGVIMIQGRLKHKNYYLTDKGTSVG